MIPPDKHFEGAVDGEGWYKVFTVEYEEPKYEYAQTRDLDELLKGLSNIVSKPVQILYALNQTFNTNFHLPISNNW